MIGDSVSTLKIPKTPRYNSGNKVKAAKKKAKKETSISSMALVFRAQFSTWKEAADELGLTSALLYRIAMGEVKSSPKFREAMGLIRKDRRTKRTHYSLRISNARLRTLTTDDAAWAAFRQDLRQESERRENQ